jgi:nucleotide-binding universal stress UspA family protein
VTAKVLHDASAAVWTSTGSAMTEHQPGIPYKRIICALDETEEAEAVVRAAAALADSYRAELFLLRAVDMPPNTLEVDFSTWREQLRDAAEYRIKQLQEQSGISAPVRISDLMVTDAIRDEVIRRKADLVVTGRGKSQTAVNRLWSALYSIVRESPCPVLSI